MTYGKRLEKALTDAKKKRRHLAMELGVTPQAIGMVITGGGLAERKLSFENNQKAAKFLHVDADWLNTGEGKPEEVAQAITPYEDDPSPMARELSIVFDVIPESATLKRAKAFSLCTTAIAAILQGENVTLVPSHDPKRQ